MPENDSLNNNPSAGDLPPSSSYPASLLSKIRRLRNQIFFWVAIVLIGITVLWKAYTFIQQQLVIRPVLTMQALIVGILAIGTVIVVVLTKPQFLSVIADFVKKYLILVIDKFFYFLNVFTQKISSWGNKFQTSTPGEKWRIARLPLFLVLIIFLLLKFGPFFHPPVVLTSFPGQNSLENPLETKIEVIFDKEVIKQTAEKSFRIKPPIPGSFSWEGEQKLIFTPQEPLQRDNHYQVGFDGLVLSKFFIPMVGFKNIDFSTLGEPKVILAAPQNEALEDLTPVTVVFDRPMIPLTTATNSAVKQPAFEINPPLVGQGRWLGTTSYQFRPSLPFKKATTYQVTVFSGLKSQDGGVLKQNYQWQFSSARPRVEDVSPSLGERFASPVASIAAFFTQNMEYSSLVNSFKVLDKNKTEIPGKVVVNGKVVGFYPLTPLARLENYEAVVKNGAQSTDGPNGLEDDYYWNFTTTDFPGVISTEPKNKAKTTAGELYNLQVYFKTPMDEDSFADNVTIIPKPATKPYFSFSSYNNQNSLYVSSYFGPSKEYQVTIGANVKDQYGVALGKPYTFSFTTAPYKPAVSIYPSGTYFASFNQEIIPRVVTQVVNTNRVDYSLYRLSRENLLELYRRRYGNDCQGRQNVGCANWQDYDTSKLTKVRSWSENYEADLNTPVQVVTKVTDQNSQNLPAGFYFLEVKIPQGAHDNMVMIVSKSALTVKKSNNQIFTWSVNQSTAQVIPGMKLELADMFNNKLAEGVSNQDGVWQKEVNLLQKNDLFVFGKNNDDAVVAASAWSEGINRYDFGLPSYYDPNERNDYYAEKNYKSYLTLDRPIYRPGQKVYFKGVIKKDNDGAYQNLEPGEKVTVKITDAQNRAIFTQVLPIDSFGSFWSEFVLSKNASLGNYELGVDFKGNGSIQQFQVEEYRKPELAVSVTTNKPAYTQGEIAQAAINASYYFGAPVTEAPVTWTLQTEDYSFRWDKDWRYEFGDPDSYWSRPWWYYSGSSYYSGTEVTQGKGITNTKGDLELSLPLDIAKYKTSQKMRVEAVVNDISNQSIAASTDFTVHKGEIYAGIHPVSYANQSGKEVQVEIVTVDLKGLEVPETPVEVSFYKRTWETVREQNTDDGEFYYVAKPTDTLLISTRVTTDRLGYAKASFTPVEGGTVKVVARVSDKNGKQNVSGSFLWVSGYGFSTARENNDRIVLVTDKRDYLVGETVSVFVATPFATDSAKTLLTAERGNVLDYQVVDTSDTSNNFPIAIPPKFAPNAFISAVLVRGGNDLKKPPEFKMGYTEIKVTDKKQQVEVAITTDKKRYKPKETLKATIQTKDLLGHPVSTQLAVGLVDKAVWDLAQIELADIYKTFYQPRNLDVDTAQLLTISLDRINANLNLGAKGGSGGCFTAETPILMKDYSYKSIKDVKTGDVILTRESENSSKLVEAKVIKTFKHLVNDYLILNGEIEVTAVHRMLVNGEWKTAGEIQVGDYLLDKNNQPVKVTSKEYVFGKDFDVYNLETEKYHTYFAKDVYVHNQKGGGNDTSRVNFPDTTYWNPNLTTDQNGKISVQIKLPDNLTTWRLGAIANSKDTAVGSAVSEVIVSRDLLIRPFLPRFLSVGDEAQLGAIVANTSGEEQNTTVKIETEGIKINEPNTKQQVLADGAQAKLTWKTQAQDVKEAKIKISVAGSDGVTRDVVEIKLPVKSYSVPETVATAGNSQGNKEEKILLPNDVDKTQGSAAISLSPSLGAASINALTYLIDYPYNCVEQITSRFLPAVFANRVFTKAGIEKSGLISAKELTMIISDGVQRLNSQQHADGGWGWWPELQSDPFVTAYAYLGLSEAKKDKFSVADQTLTKARDYLVQHLSSVTPPSLNTQAFILYVLKDSGVNLASYTSNLYTRRFEMSLESRANLAVAMSAIPTASGRGKKLNDELISLAKKTATTTHWEEQQTNYGYYMGSNTTATAAVLESIMSYNKNNPLISEVIRYLMTTRRDGHWASTRDTAAVIKTIATQLLLKGDEKLNEDYRFSLNGKTIKEGKFVKEDLLRVEDLTLGITQLKIGTENSLTFAKSGEGNLYYNVNLKYFLPFTEIKPLEQGMVVVRELVDSKGNILPSGSLPENSEAWVRLIIVAPEERHFVVIEDILPAGLESVNESLKTSSVLSAKSPKLKEKGDRNLYFEHKEYHDDRTSLFADYLPAGVYEFTYRVRATTPGRYHHPPASAYQMYTPDVSGHSDGGWFEVR
ncbi:Ig-like domain-containing protein [Candidatus Microgenomates bacterium]|nr:Ig-like domain-containing protein [Candidatus Microgenomates bacterium]